ncbi:cytochrome P450 [Butyriboletus roseoflavus]|nr:cytochrome P450 [Butyriboletus roseoflavus]
MPIMSTSSWAGAFALVLGGKLVLDLIRRYFEKPKAPLPCPLPPGPPGLPLVGNVIGFNREAPWLTYTEWAKTYGDLVYTQLLGKHIVIINSEKIAKDLLEYRSRNYSDRPSFVTNELFGTDFNSVLLPYGDRWRLHRRFFHQTFRADSVTRFAPMQQLKSFQLLRNLLERPSQLEEHIFEYTASAIMNAVYDYDPVSRKDPIVDIVKNMINVAVDALRFDISIIFGAIPGLPSLPSWLPGMSFKRTVASSRIWAKECVEKPFNYSLQKIKSGSASCSMICDALQKTEEEGIPADSAWTRGLKEAAATGFLAASETSNSVILTFFLMMVLFPDAQKKAQAQIDEIIGKGRLPCIQDRPSLPYIDAILRETLRYNPVIPLSVPHAAADADVFDGYYIPKGAIIISNLWSMAHNESKYPRPFEFLPERFLDDDGTLKSDDTQNIAFGFGRRICVGRYFADTSMWFAMATILAVFTVSKTRDEHGREVPVVPEFTSGLAV